MTVWRLRRPARGLRGAPVSRPALRPVVGCVAASLLAAALAGCTRAHCLTYRLDDVRDDRARTLLRDAVWAHGSKYAWAEAGVLRAEVTWAEHHPVDGRTRREVWAVDPVTGGCRIEIPATDEVMTRDLRGLRVTRGGKAVCEAHARALAAGRVRLATELLPLPVSLPGKGRAVTCAGDRIGPAEARRWQRLAVAYGPGSGMTPGDRTVVELAAGSNRVARAILWWSDLPLASRPTCVEMDVWQPVGDLLVSRRWRFRPANEAGEPIGPVRATLRIDAITTDTASRP